MRHMSDSGSAQVAGASQSMITLAVLIVVGFLALVSLYMGFQAYGSDNPEDGFLYMAIGAASSDPAVLMDYTLLLFLLFAVSAAGWPLTHWNLWLGRWFTVLALIVVVHLVSAWLVAA